jgi:hypothetical protein
MDVYSRPGLGGRNFGESEFVARSAGWPELRGTRQALGEGNIMANGLKVCGHWKSAAPALLALLGSATFWPSFASAPVSERVVRVEEDWELDVNEPNDDTTAPQFHTVMSPMPDLASYHAQTLWNYRETPDFVAGGVQLHTATTESG